MADFTLWSLNQTQNLLGNGKAFFKVGGNTFYFGDRGKFNVTNNQSGDKNHNLMPEEEYFVPIAAKCIGSMFNLNKLASIKGYFQNIYGLAGNNFYDYFWQNPVIAGNTSKMITKNNIGYYEILKKTYDETGRKNILVGYSQGGLVARYLAFLDEYVFGDNIIHGVITVQSPNYGSPLADPTQGNQIVDEGVIGSALTMASMYPNVFIELTKHLQNATNFTTVTGQNNLSVNELINGLYLGNKKVLNKTEKKGKFALWFNDVLESGIKWTSGLNGNKDSAFSDLNPQNLSKPESVLHSVNTYPLKRIKCWSIISAQNDFSKLFQSVVDELIFFAGWFYRLIINSIKPYGKSFNGNLEKYNVPIN